MTISKCIEDLETGDVRHKINALQQIDDSLPQTNVEDPEYCLAVLSSQLSSNSLPVLKLSLRILQKFLVTRKCAFGHHMVTLGRQLAENLGSVNAVVRAEAEKTLYFWVKHAFPSRMNHVSDLSSFCLQHRNSKIPLHFLRITLKTWEQLNPRNMERFDFRRVSINVMLLCEHSEAQIRDLALSSLSALYGVAGKSLLELAKPRLQKTRFFELEQITAKVRPTPPFIPLFPKSRKKHKAKVIDYNEEVSDVSDEKEIEPYRIDVESCAELELLMQDVIEILTAKSVKWNLRAEALRKLAGMVNGGCMRFENFWPLFSRLQDGITLCFCDLRSSLVKQACATIEVICREAQHEFAQPAEYFIPLLLDQTSVTINVVSSSVNSALRTLVQFSGVGQSPVIAKICSRISHRSAHVRLRAVEALKLLLEADPKPKYLQRRQIDILILENLREGLTDRNEHVRCASRMLLWAMHEIFPTKVQTFLSTLSQSSIVIQAKKTYEPFTSPFQKIVAKRVPEKEISPSSCSISSNVESPSPETKEPPRQRLSPKVRQKRSMRRRRILQESNQRRRKRMPTFRDLVGIAETKRKPPTFSAFLRALAPHPPLCLDFCQVFCKLASAAPKEQISACCEVQSHKHNSRMLSF